MKSDVGILCDVMLVKSLYVMMFCLVVLIGIDCSFEVIVVIGLIGDINDGISRCFLNDYVGICCCDCVCIIDE